MNSFKKSIVGITIISFFTLASCTGNSFYYKKDTNSLATCSGGWIRALSIKENPSEKLYFLNRKQSVQGLNEVQFEGFSAYFDIESPLNSEYTDTFVLKSNSEYIIENYTVGDAAYKQIILKTGIDGKVISASDTTCF